MARGNITKNGTFVLGSEGTRDGIPQGKYRVYFQGTSGAAVHPDTGVNMEVERVAAKFQSIDKSGLSCDIDKSKSVEFTVEYPTPNGLKWSKSKVSN